MKVLVINEPFVDLFCRTQRWAARTRGRVLRAPDWLAYATAVLEQAGLDVELYDFPAKNWGIERLGPLVRERGAEVVVLDSTTPSIFSDVRCAQLAKEAGARQVIMVGPHASALPDQVLKDADGAVDVVCRGEYDYTVRDVVLADGNLAGVPGIAYREGDGRIVHTPARPFIQDLDAVPFPAWHHLDLLNYFDGGKLYPYITIISSRGCSYGCSFCIWPQVMHGHRIRKRSAKNVIDEMEHDIELCPQVLQGGEFYFEDDSFTENRDHVLAICDEIRRRGLKATWAVNGRVDAGDHALFQAMREAGCRRLLVGFESGDQTILRNIDKHLDLKRSYRFMEDARRAGLVVHGCFIMGLPGETRETMERSIDFACSLGLDTVQFAAAVPYPGTKYYEQMLKAGLLRAESWDRWLGDDGEQVGVVDYPGLSRREVEAAVDRGLRRFYFRPGYMLKFLLSTRTTRDLYRKVRGAVNFVRYLRQNRGRRQAGGSRL